MDANRHVLDLSKPIGFGCSDLQFGLDTRRSKQILFKALDVGIEYFDTAPRYALSEQFLGKYLPKHESVKIATKVGLDPLIADAVSLIADQIKRRMKSWCKRSVANRRQSLMRDDSLVNETAFPEIIYPKYLFDQSIQNSLKNLNTERLDVLLIHEPERLANLQEVIFWAENLIPKGTVKEVGCAVHRFGSNLAESKNRSRNIIWQFPWSARENFVDQRQRHHLIFGAASLLYTSRRAEQLDRELAQHPATVFLIKTSKTKHLDWVEEI